MFKSDIFKITSLFWKDENGAVTVDWVMLTSGVVLLGVLVVSGISTALNDAATEIGSTISSAVS